MLQNEQSIRKAAEIMAILRPIELTWLEAAVLLHYYTRYLSVQDVADLVNLRLEDVEAARWSLVRKVAWAFKLVEGVA